MVHSGMHTVKGRSKCNINFGKWFAFLSFSEVYAIGHELFVRLGSSKLPFNCNHAGLDIWWTSSSESTKASDTAMALFFYNSIRCKLSVWSCIKYPSVSSVSLDGVTNGSEQKTEERPKSEGISFSFSQHWAYNASRNAQGLKTLASSIWSEWFVVTSSIVAVIGLVSKQNGILEPLKPLWRKSLAGTQQSAK